MLKPSHAMIGVIASFVLLSAHANDEARLFAIEKGNHLAFLLPVTHVGTPMETGGEYLSDVIIPAFRTATALYDESAPLASPSTMLNKCPDGDFVDADLDKELHEEFELATKGSHWDNHYPPFKKMLSRFAKMRLIQLPPERPSFPGEIRVMTQPIQYQLRARFPIPIDSIETIEDLFGIYCSLTQNERREYVSNVIAMSRSTSDEPKFASAEELRKKINEKATRGYLKSLHSTIAEYKDPRIETGKELAQEDFPLANRTFFRVIVDERNALWITKMNVNSETTEIPLYALGAAHFHAYGINKGLISLLREEGYSITLVTNQAELNAILAKHQLKKRPMSDQMSQSD